MDLLEQPPLLCNGMECACVYINTHTHTQVKPIIYTIDIKMKEKYEALEKFKDFCAESESLIGHSIRCIR